MRICVYDTKDDLGIHAAALGAERIRRAIAAKGRASIILATGASQFEMLGALTKEAGVNWPKVTVFHLDEYVGFRKPIPPASANTLKSALPRKCRPWPRFITLTRTRPISKRRCAA